MVQVLGASLRRAALLMLPVASPWPWVQKGFWSSGLGMSWRVWAKRTKSGNVEHLLPVSS